MCVRMFQTGVAFAENVVALIGCVTFAALFVVHLLGIQAGTMYQAPHTHTLTTNTIHYTLHTKHYTLTTAHRCVSMLVRCDSRRSHD